ncbi:MAG: UDP-N-acetylmuramoyl-L-alanyl-D-glutamate--2,6-diaminopimelate ligase [Pseudomonadota bacterium]
MKRLSELGLRATPDPQITGLAVDSRQVKPGALFAALPGEKMHGAEFITYALRMGASAILTDAAGAEIARDDLQGSEAALVVSDDPRSALAYAAALWYGAQPETLVAITGTNGKTSVASFTRQLWQALGQSAANLGTTGIEGDAAGPLSHTTPEPITLHKVLSELAESGITHAAMEASSHGLMQRRLDGAQLKAAAFTTFSQDHLEYHKTFEAYFDAKALLFERVLSPEGVAVLNMDDPHSAAMAERAAKADLTCIKTGLAGQDVQIAAQRFDALGQDVLFRIGSVQKQVRLDLIGGFQAQNVAVAIGLALATGASAAEVLDVAHTLKTVRGRMELAAKRQSGAAIFVDYAHTPGAISTALAALRPHTLGRVITVIGAGGDRDPSKRAAMGAAAQEHADLVFVTDDNPRSEDPAAIRDMVMEGAPDAINVGDRAEAILRAVDALEAGDTLLIAGKGHETGQVIGTDVYPFDDAEHASVAVAALEGAL